MQVVPLLIKKTQKTIQKGNTIKHLYTCFDGGWETLFKYAENDSEAKAKFEETINPDHKYQVEFIDPDVRKMLDDDLTILKLKD